MPKVRFYLNTPLAFYGNKPLQPLMFDGILGYAWAIKNGLLKTPSEANQNNLLFPELPLEEIGDKCYAASACFIPQEATMTPSMINRRADWAGPMARHGVKTMRYDVAVGWQQACQEVIWELATPYVDFYFNGNKKGVVDLLSIIFKMRYLGSKRGIGYGLIRKIDIKDKSEDWAIWRDGQPTRPLPVEIVGEKPGLTAEWFTYYPPYWMTTNGTWCYTPPQEQWLPRRNAIMLSNRLEQYFKDKQQKSSMADNV
jgi:CRISPR type IV-associated protein Csf3